MHVFSEIDQFLAFLKSPIRSLNNDFIAFRLEEYDKTPHLDVVNCVKTLFYRVSLIMNESLDFSINNGDLQTSRRCTLCFISPFHFVSFRQNSPLQGQSFQFSESFIHHAYESTRFHKDFPFFWSDNSFFFIEEKDARVLIQLGAKIIHETNDPSRFSESIIQDYLHIFLLEAKRMIGVKDIVEDSSTDYLLFRQFFMLINKSSPVIRSVESAAAILSVTPARLWLVVKRLSGQTPSDIINQRLLREAQTLLLHSDLSVSEICFYLQFREKPHFTRFFKNLTGLTPLEYSRQSGFRNR